MMNGALGDMGGYIVLAFFAAVFIALFNWSNLGVIMSVNGAEWLKGMGFVGLPLLVAIIFVSAGINIDHVKRLRERLPALSHRTLR